MNVNKYNQQSINQYFSLENVKVEGIGKSNIYIMNNIIGIRALYTDTIVEIPINNMDFILYNKGILIFNSNLFFGAEGNQYKISCKDRQGLRQLYDVLIYQKIIIKKTNAKKEDTINSALNQNRKLNPSDEILKFHNLFEQGIITKEEFEEKKKELLKK